MSDQTLLALAAVVATALGSFGVLGQILVARRQAHLQEATAYRDQAAAWRALKADWLRLLLAGLGPDGAQRRGVDRDVVEKYAADLGEYRSARVAVQDVMQDSALAQRSEAKQSAVWDATWKRERKAWEALLPIEDGVRRVLLHLAQTADLILRKRLSIHAVYDALGHDIMRDRIALGVVTRYAYDYGGCIAPWNQEIRWWRDLPLEEISPRVGWAQALATSPGTLSRIDVLFDLIAIRAFEVGDGSDEATGDYLVSQLGDRSVMAARWRVLSKVSRVQAARFTWRASRVRELQRGRPRPFATIKYSERKVAEIIPALSAVVRYMCRPIVSLVDIPRTAWMSRNKYDPNRWIPPIEEASEQDPTAVPSGKS